MNENTLHFAVVTEVWSFTWVGLSVNDCMCVIRYNSMLKGTHTHHRVREICKMHDIVCFPIVTKNRADEFQRWTKHGFIEVVKWI